MKHEITIRYRKEEKRIDLWPTREKVIINGSRKYERHSPHTVRVIQRLESRGFIKEVG